MTAIPRLSRLEEITDLSTIWHDEAKDFTDWLAKEENMHILSQSAGLEISAEETHSPVGKFRVDILASESGTNRRAIIISSFSQTEDSGLGRVITLAAGKNADIIIWIVRHANEEHKAAVEWLNSRTGNSTGIFLCEVKLFRIGSSEPAVKFEVISRPNNWAKEVRKISEDASSIEKLRFDYWNAFQDYAFDGGSNPRFAASYRRWQTSSNYGVVFGTGRPGVSIIIAKTRDDIEAGLNIADDRELFSRLLARKDDIESEAGMNFDWLELPGRKGSRIRAKKSPAPLTDKSSWPEQFDWIMSSVMNIRETFSRHMKEADDEQ
ncbi:MAG: DUF4268 domain-containing protein [Synergistaceae bacterium]|nr:DUF4268 domain-containing protein [Synergistaceae bacterium]